MRHFDPCLRKERMILRGMGNGVYIPSSISIPANGSYDFTADPILFYPNSTFYGGTDGMVLTDASSDCIIREKINFPYYYSSGLSKATPQGGRLLVSPNPATEEVTIEYDTGSPLQKYALLQIHDVAGNKVYEQELKEPAGRQKLDLSHWHSGWFTLSLISGEQLLQKKLLKQ